MNLPPMNPVPAMDLDQFSPGEKAVSIRACENFARLYGEAVREACARECDAKSKEWIACGPTVNWEYRAHGAEDCAEAIRNGVIREGEGEKTAAASKRERWICLLCKSSRKGQHGTLDDKVTPCPNGALTRSTG